MAYARYETLKRMAEGSQFGFTQTNELGSAGKGHLLQLRREGLVNYTGVGMPGYKLLARHGVNLSYAGKLANWYSITFKGLQKLLELWPESEEIRDLAHDAITWAFSDKEMIKKEVAFRMQD